MVHRPIIGVFFEWAGPVVMDLFVCTAGGASHGLDSNLTHLFVHGLDSNLTHLFLYLSYKLVVINKLIIRILIVEFNSVIS